MVQKVKMVTVIGAGIMGHALAIVFARGGLDVFLTDIDRQKLDQAGNLIKSYLEFSFSQGLIQESPGEILKRIKTAETWDSFVPRSDLIIEAIIEDVEAKKEIIPQSRPGDRPGNHRRQQHFVSRRLPLGPGFAFRNGS